MKIKLAETTNTREVIYFFNRFLSIESDGVSSPEFFCPLGLNAAVRNRQVLIAINETRIVGALRLYKKKTKHSISLYQFAIEPTFRRQGLLGQMLLTLDSIPIEYLCPLTSELNQYFLKTGWSLIESKNNLNHWLINLSNNNEGY